MTTRAHQAAPAAGAASGAAPAADARTFVLRDGRTVVVGEAYGRHLEQASLVIGGDMSNLMGIVLAVGAAVSLVDGKPITYEEIRELPLSDALKFAGAIAGNFQSPTLATSSS